MRRRAAPFLLPLVLSGVVAALSCAPGHAQYRTQRRPPAAAATSGPPHAWLFGTWTGGLFPVLDGMLAQDCRSPSVIFTQDVVGHTSLTGAGLARRVIETVRTTPSGAEFRFSPAPDDAGAFGCESSDVLHVARESDSTISFPHCAAFPYPLHRCAPGQ